MHGFWVFVSALGESRLLVPAALGAMYCMALADRPAAINWLWRFAVAGAVVLVSKIAFLGWGYGWAAIDFTGFSGHSMVSAAIYPVLGYAVGNTYSRRAAGWSAAAGVLLAVLIMVSRIILSAHSPSEAMLGLLIGLAVSAGALACWPANRAGVRIAAVVLGFALSWLASVSVAPQARTHDAVVALALALSGENSPYTRTELHAHLPPR